MNATALIAEDEPLLAAALQAELARAWPDLRVLATAGDGDTALSQALALQPDLLFLDIRMPGLSGLEVAEELADAWPSGQPLPVLVFATAYDQYAVKAFEAQALDYLLKPVQAERLAITVQRAQAALAQRRQGLDDPTLQRLRALLAAAPEPAPAHERLRVIQASVGQTLRLVPVDEVLVLQAADKYVRVLTAQDELLVRTPLKELLARLDPEAFWPIHRGTVLRATAIERVERTEAGRLVARLRQRPEPWPVSRLHEARFRAM